MMDVSKTWAWVYANMTKKETEALIQNEGKKEKEIENNVALISPSSRHNMLDFEIEWSQMLQNG